MYCKMFWVPYTSSISRPSGKRCLRQRYTLQTIICFIIYIHKGWIMLQSLTHTPVVLKYRGM